MRETRTVRGSTIALVFMVSLAFGIATGLTIAWGLWPVEFINADPSDLRSSYKDDYVRMIGAGYELDGNLDAARAQLAQLKFANPTAALNQLLVQPNSPARQTNAIVALAQDLGLNISATEFVRAPTPEPPAISANAAPTPNAITYRVAEKSVLTCTDEPGDARLRFFVRDAQGRDLPNIAIEIRWESGEEVVVTGLKPEQGPGYADFDAAPGTYQSNIQNAAGESATDLIVGTAPANCKTDRGATPRGWKIVFRQK
ncbi:MAG: hypothetical protein HY327_03450 [Chloroflexi bacterium]|nr:hypothetical protein [Chloroflexota bacterium]